MRDIKSEDLITCIDLLDSEDTNELGTTLFMSASLSRSRSLPNGQGAREASFVDVLNALRPSVRAGRVPLFVCLSESYQSDELDVIFRFAHLTFQEFLSAKYISAVLRGAHAQGQAAFADAVKEMFTTPGSPQLFDRLHQSWWLQVLSARY